METTTSSPADRGTWRFLWYAALALVALAAILVAIPAWETISYKIGMPVMFDRQGSSITDHAVRVLNGQAIYVEPDETFCPLLYTPLYYYTGAAFMAVLGEGIVTMRILSLTLVSGALLACLVTTRRLTRSWWATALVLPLGLAAYPNSGWFMDQPRVDTSSSFWLILGFALAIFARKARTGLLIGACFFLAIWTKQSAALVVAMFLGLLLFTKPRVSLLAGVVLAIAGPVGVFVSDAVSDGWFWIFAVDTNGKDPFDLDRLVMNLGADWGGPLLGVGLLLIPVAFLLWRRWQGDEIDRRFLHLLFAVVALSVYTSISRARLGGSPKTLMPLCLLTSAFLPVGTWWLARHFADRARFLGTLVIAWVVFFARFDPKLILPDNQTLKRWDQFELAMSYYAQQGQIWPTLWGYLTTPMEGQEMVPTLIELNWYFGFEEEPRYPVPPRLAQAIEERHFSAIFLPERKSPYPFMGLIEKHYDMLDTEHRIRVGIERHSMRIRTFVPRRRDGSDR